MPSANSGNDKRDYHNFWKPKIDSFNCLPIGGIHVLLTAPWIGGSQYFAWGMGSFKVGEEENSQWEAQTPSLRWRHDTLKKLLYCGWVMGAIFMIMMAAWGGLNLRQARLDRMKKCAGWDDSQKPDMMVITFCESD